MFYWNFSQLAVLFNNIAYVFNNFKTLCWICTRHLRNDPLTKSLFCLYIEVETCSRREIVYESNLSDKFIIFWFLRNIAGPINSYWSLHCIFMWIQQVFFPAYSFKTLVYMANLHIHSDEEYIFLLGIYFT